MSGKAFTLDGLKLTIKNIFHGIIRGYNPNFHLTPSAIKQKLLKALYQGKNQSVILKSFF